MEWSIKITENRWRKKSPKISLFCQVLFIKSLFCQVLFINIIIKMIRSPSFPPFRLVSRLPKSNRAWILDTSGVRKRRTLVWKFTCIYLVARCLFWIFTPFEYKQGLHITGRLVALFVSGHWAERFQSIAYWDGAPNEYTSWDGGLEEWMRLSFVLPTASKKKHTTISNSCDRMRVSFTHIEIDDRSWFL